MAGTSINLSVRGVERLQAFVQQLAAPDWDPLLDGIGALLVSRTEERIAETKRDPEGARWEPLKPQTAARKKKGGILEFEGDLRDSLVHLVSGETVEVGTNLIYGATHQFGDEDRNIPARPFLGIGPEDEAKIDELLDEWFEQLTAA